ncbi:MAG: DNA-directed RNA polymerase subunit alpha [Anaerolineae bacterium]|nr:DNA-directed RNA polymerase subunit alpha [Anaerolineae bacterium]RIK34557.1 MAG: DNA-directed RNA polymerase subunit alpha [Chloroflexota bacterium]
MVESLFLSSAFRLRFTEVVLLDIFPKIEAEANSKNYGKFVIGPLESGYGVTLGNALRRVLLSSLPGAAVTSIKVDGVHHEFTPIPNAKEDTTQLILNVKQLRMKMHGEEGPVRLLLEARGKGNVTAADIQAPAQIEIINSDLHLLTLDSDDAAFVMDLTVNRGKGYQPAESGGKLAIDEIPVDAIFSPVRKANFRVERARVQQMTNFDSLVMEIWTDGSISPREALTDSAKLLVKLLGMVAGFAGEESVEATSDSEIPSRIYETPIEELELSVRAYNCLKRASITKVGEILEKLQKGREELLNIRNFGQKSLDELMERLEEKGYLEVIQPPPDLVAPSDGAGFSDGNEE